MVSELTVNKVLSDEEILSNVKAHAGPVKRPVRARRRTRQILEWKTPGFGGKSRVLTSFGPLPLEALRKNDPVKTATGDFVKVAWIDRFGLDAEFLSVTTQAQPILIPAGTFAPARPERDMFVSPAQKIQISPTLASAEFKHASALSGWARIARKHHTAFTYYLFGFEDACTVCVDGLWCSMPIRAA